MSRQRASLCAILISQAAVFVQPADFPDDLEKWIATAPPVPGSEDWLAANQDVKHEWSVTLRDGRPRVQLRAPKTPAPLPFEIGPGSRREGLAGERLSVKVPDGWIVAFNSGEFGAGLWWFSPEGAERRKIAEAWITSFVSRESDLLAIEGLAHGGESKGRILRVFRDSAGRWRSETLVDLKHAPQAVAGAQDGSLLIATTNRLLKVSPAEKKVEVCLADAFWGGLYPNSLVVAPDGTAYLGMRHGVAKIEKHESTYRVIWLLPNKDFIEVKPAERFK